MDQRGPLRGHVLDEDCHFAFLRRGRRLLHGGERAPQLDIHVRGRTAGAYEERQGDQEHQEALKGPPQFIGFLIFYLSKACAIF